METSRDDYLALLMADLERANQNFQEAVKYRNDARLAYEELADDAQEAFLQLERTRQELLKFIESDSARRAVAA